MRLLLQHPIKSCVWLVLICFYLLIINTFTSNAQGTYPIQRPNANTSTTAETAPNRDSTAALPEIARNTIFIEGLGNGITYSINAERLIMPNWSVRAGFGTFNVDIRVPFTDLVALRGSFVSLPLTTSYLLNLGGSASHLEFGVGITPIFAAGSLTAPIVGNLPAAFATVLGTGVIGYRLQPPSGGFNFRIGLTPIVLLSPFFLPLPSVGIALGYTFGGF
ncbi:MAG: hypothetical protein EAZ92_04180 [Candidatus Kapaibacterium sp.]|nr:MAG: hypothetical protein EAZ92_04180 [Candidatus Kapabacteria bacterium]